MLTSFVRSREQRCPDGYLTFAYISMVVCMYGDTENRDCFRWSDWSQSNHMRPWLKCMVMSSQGTSRGFFFFFFLPEREECSRRENQLFSQLGCCFRLWAVGPHVGIGDNLLGTRGSPPQADSQEMGTLVLQPWGTGFCYALSVPGGESVPELIRASTNSHLSLWFTTAEPMRNSDP